MCWSLDLIDWLWLLLEPTRRPHAVRQCSQWRQTGRRSGRSLVRLLSLVNTTCPSTVLWVSGSGCWFWRFFFKQNMEILRLLQEARRQDSTTPVHIWQPLGDYEKGTARAWAGIKISECHVSWFRLRHIRSLWETGRQVTAKLTGNPWAIHERYWLCARSYCTFPN